MCGIVGCILKDKEKPVAPILLECVENLDYRGYDSVGIATFDGSIHVKKADDLTGDSRTDIGTDDDAKRLMKCKNPCSDKSGCNNNGSR